MTQKNWKKTTERAMDAIQKIMDTVPDAPWIFIAAHPTDGTVLFSGHGCPHANQALLSVMVEKNDQMLIDHVCGEEHDSRRN